MVVNRPRLEIEWCKCLSQDAKRVFKNMVRSHNSHLSRRRAELREEMMYVRERRPPPSLDFTEVLKDQEASILLEQQLMEDWQDFFDDLPTCDEYHHPKAKRAAWEICPDCGGELVDGRRHDHRDDNVGNIPYVERPRADY